MTNIVLAEAYARLTSLRQNVPSPFVEVKYVDEFHQIVELLECATGAKLEQLRIPESEVRPVVMASNYLDGSEEYSRESYCNHPFFTMKIDSVLIMFEMVMGSRPSPSGFGTRNPVR
jgi:hypothetical protein